MSNKKAPIDTKETELELLTREINRLQIRRASIEQEAVEELKHASNNDARRRSQQVYKKSYRKGRKSAPDQYKSREAVVREQYSQKALNKFVKIKEEILQKYGRNSKSRSYHTPLLDLRRQEIRAGDFVRAVTTGRNYTDRGIVSRFSKDGSRVYFIDYQGIEQN